MRGDGTAERGARARALAALAALGSARALRADALGAAREGSGLWLGESLHPAPGEALGAAMEGSMAKMAWARPFGSGWEVGVEGIDGLLASMRMDPAAGALGEEELAARWMAREKVALARRADGSWGWVRHGQARTPARALARAMARDHEMEGAPEAQWARMDALGQAALLRLLAELGAITRERVADGLGFGSGEALGAAGFSRPGAKAGPGR